LRSAAASFFPTFSLGEPLNDNCFILFIFITD